MQKLLLIYPPPPPKDVTNHKSNESESHSAQEIIFSCLQSWRCEFSSLRVTITTARYLGDSRASTTSVLDSDDSRPPVSACIQLIGPIPLFPRVGGNPAATSLADDLHFDQGTRGISAGGHVGRDGHGRGRFRVTQFYGAVTSSGGGSVVGPGGIAAGRADIFRPARPYPYKNAADGLSLTVEINFTTVGVSDATPDRCWFWGEGPGSTVAFFM